VCLSSKAENKARPSSSLKLKFELEELRQFLLSRAQVNVGDGHLRT